MTASAYSYGDTKAYKLTHMHSCGRTRNYIPTTHSHMYLPWLDSYCHHSHAHTHTLSLSYARAHTITNDIYPRTHSNMEMPKLDSHSCRSRARTKTQLLTLTQVDVSPEHMYHLEAAAGGAVQVTPKTLTAIPQAHMPVPPKTDCAPAS